MSRELLASQKNNSGILLDPRTKLAVLITIAVFILGGSYEGIMQYYIIVLAAIPLLLLSAARKWKGAVLYILIFGGSLCLEMFGLSRLTGVANYIAVAVVGILLRFTPSVVISTLTVGKTLIVIAHRLSTIVGADNIIVVKDGTIHAQGTHEKLLETCPLYRDMWQAHIGAKDQM